MTLHVSQYIFIPATGNEDNLTLLNVIRCVAVPVNAYLDNLHNSEIKVAIMQVTVLSFFISAYERS